MANDALFKIPSHRPDQPQGLMILTGLGVWLLVIGGCAVLLLLHKLPPSSANVALVIVSFLFLPSLMTFWRVQNLRYKLQTPVNECSMLLQPATHKIAPPALAVNYVVGDNGEMIPQVETEALK